MHTEEFYNKLKENVEDIYDLRPGADPETNTIVKMIRSIALDTIITTIAEYEKMLTNT